jgi:hypothetical protein
MALVALVLLVGAGVVLFPGVVVLFPVGPAVEVVELLGAALVVVELQPARATAATTATKVLIISVFESVLN